MPASRDKAYALLHAYGTLEFLLKRIPRYTRAGNYENAQANLSAVMDVVERLRPEDFLDVISQRTKAKVLNAPRNRPKRQKVIEINGENHTQFLEDALPASDARSLIEAMRRVRNNLFHGGKNDPLEEPHPGDDDEWVDAALEVAERLLDLVHNNVLTP